MDHMLRSASQVEGECTEWITEHQEHLEKEFRLASARTEEALRHQARNNLEATNTSVPVGARVFLRYCVKGRNKIQDVRDATQYRVIRRLDTRNTYVVVPLKTLPGEESRKTVHRNDILHATQLVKDMGLGTSPSAGPGVGGEDILSSDVLSEEGTGSGDEDDDLELVILRQQSSALGGIQENLSNYFDGQPMFNDDSGQSQSEIPKGDVAHSDQELQITAQLAVDGDADPEEPEALQAGTSGGAGAKAMPANDDTNTSAPVRCSTRAGAGQHSNPHRLPRSVMREGGAAAVIDPQILNSVAQSNLLTCIMQLLAKNAQM